MFNWPKGQYSTIWNMMTDISGSSSGETTAKELFRLFTWITLPVFRFLHRRGIYFHPYLDDCLMKSHFRFKLTTHVSFIQLLLTALGWLIITKKSSMEWTQNLQFIRTWLNPGLGLVQIPNDIWTKIQMAVHHPLMEELALRQWQCLLCLLTSA